MIKALSTLFAYGALALLILSPFVAEAQSLSMASPNGFQVAEQAPTVGDIQIEGAQRLEPETVASYLTISRGDEVTSETINASLKALYATGLFSDIQIAMKESTLVVKVTENPIVNQITFEGNSELTKEDLEKEVQLKSRLVYTLPRVQKDVQRILDLYRRSGRFAAIVEPKLVQLPQNRVDVIFEITEGERTGVRKIAFIGNENYDEDALRGAINTRESAWWRFLSTSDFYDPDRTNYDKELLRRYYLTQGYIDFRVLSAVAELTPDRGDFFLTFTIEEGSRYKFGKIAIQSDIKGLDGDSLMPQLLTKEGEFYNVDAVEKSVAKLTTVLGDMQYAFVEIVPDVDRHKEALTVDLTYRIKEGHRVYINRIDVTGNNRTLDKVIRREMLLAEGDPFSTTKVQRSEQRIKDLGFFESVKVAPADAGQPDRADLKVEVKEKSTGEISFGAGFSSTEGPLGDFSIREKNFLGKGQDVRLGATVSGVTKQFDLSFTEPFFLDRDLSAGADVFHVMRNNQTQSSYDETDTGFGLRLGFPLSDDLRQMLSYSLHQDEISNVPSTASRFIRDQTGESITSMVGNQLTYDVRDSKLEPTTGFMTRLNTDFAGVGGSRNFARLRLLATQYFSLAEDLVLSATGEGGYIWGIGQGVRINDRFFLGGDNLRGFATSGIGPRDQTGGADDALGGNRFLRGSLEMSFPLPMPAELGFKGHIFTDAGTLGGLDEKPLPGELFENNESLRASAGVGVTWSSPFGPVRLDVAHPIMKESFDKTETLHFSFGTRF